MRKQRLYKTFSNSL